MKIISNVICLTAIIIFFNLNVSANDQLDAACIIDKYFQALREGDTRTLKILLGGYLLRKRKQLLENPRYPALLKKTYRNADFHILNSTIANNQVTIDVDIIFNSSEKITMRFLLIKEASVDNESPQFRIHSQLELY